MQSGQKLLSVLTCIFLNVVLLLSVMPASARNGTDEQQTDGNIPVLDYLMVAMEHEYSFPEKPYDVEYFGSEYVNKVEVIFDQEGITDLDNFNLIYMVYLTEEGKANIWELSHTLTDKEEILVAEVDYYATDPYLAEPDINEKKNIEVPDESVPEGAIPIDDYLLVCLEHDYSFPEKDYDSAYYDAELVESVEPVYTYGDGNLVDKDKFYRVDAVYLNEQGKEQIDTFAERLTARDDILIAQRDYACKNVYCSITPNDPRYVQQSGYYNKIMCQKAWAITTGSSSVKVGIVDSGVESSHPDLSANMNTSLSHNCVPLESDLSDVDGHGTGIAGIIGAAGNNSLGMTGVEWQANLVNLRVGSVLEGLITSISVLNAVNYAKNNGIYLLNMSIGGLVYNLPLKQAINSYTGLCVVAAGNDNSTTLSYPAKYNTANMIIVAASDAYDNLSSCSNYNPSTVDMAAPGDDIVVLGPSNNYGVAEGTSCSAPLVTGTLALMKSANSSLSSSQLKTMLLNSVDVTSGLTGKVTTNGRLNSFRAVRKAAGYIMGDANLDGSITAADSRKVLRWSANLETYSDLQEALCDVDYSDSIEAEDARLILQMSANLIPQIE